MMLKNYQISFCYVMRASDFFSQLVSRDAAQVFCLMHMPTRSVWFGGFHKLCD
uniref:Uncharacterized protein n=1 Tax=Rhizophora mucronata TaxID=61149 RepID=A0A2P2PN60_RHIMU